MGCASVMKSFSFYYSLFSRWNGFCFYTFENIKTGELLMLSGGTEKDQWHEIA